MENRTYLVTEAEKLTGEKAHVLRYWEDELGMEIHRNSLGHRCYTAQDIQIFLGIRELKKKGLHLKAIRELMPKLVQATAEIKRFRRKRQRRQRRSRIRQYREKRTKCRRWLSIFCRAGSRTAGGHCDAAGRGGASDGVLPRARPSARSDDTEAAPGRAEPPRGRGDPPPPAEPERSSGDAGAERKTDESKTGPSEQWVNRTEKKNACERRSFWIHAEIRLILQPDNR